MFGKLLADIVRVFNVPARAMEKFIEPSSHKDDPDNILSKPLESIAKALEEID